MYVPAWERWGVTNFEVCRHCGMQRKSSVTIGGVPIDVLVVRPDSSQTTNPQTESETHQMPNFTAKTTDDIFSASNDDLAPDVHQFAGTWTNVSTLLYQPLIITDAYVEDYKNESRLDKDGNPRMSKRAVVTCYYADDVSKALMRFTSGWSQLRAQVAALALLQSQHKRPFPTKPCGVVELLDNPTEIEEKIFFPLRLLAASELDSAEDAAIEHARELEHRNVEDATPAAESPTASKATGRYVPGQRHG